MCVSARGAGLRAGGGKGPVGAAWAQRRGAPSCNFLEHLADLLEELPDLGFFDDQRGRDGDDVTGVAHHQAAVEAFLEHFGGTGARGTGARRQFDAGHQAQVAHVDDVRCALQAVGRLFERARQLAGAAEQVFAAVDVQRRQDGGGGQRVGRIGIAVKELDAAGRAVDDGVVHFAAHGDGARGHGGVAHALGHGDQVGCDAEEFGRSGGAQAAVGGDDFVKNQQDAVLGRNFAQLFQVALGRDQHAGGAGHGLDDHGGDGGRVVQRDDALQFVGQVGAPGGLALGIGVLLQVVGVGQVVHGGQQRAGEGLAVGRDAADRDAAKAHAVVAALAANQAGTLAFAAGAVIGQGDLQGGVDGLGTRVGEEDTVQALRHEAGHGGGGFEGQRVAQLEARGVVHDAGLAGNRIDDFLAAVAGVHAPQAGRAVQDLATVGRRVVHAFRCRQHAGMRLELFVGSEGHPEMGQVGQLGGGVHGGSRG